MSTYEELREKYPVFRYLSHTVTETETTLDIEYHFEIEGLTAFSPRWSFPKCKEFPTTVAKNATLEAMVFGLGMVELISYWKLTCSPRVEIYAGELTADQIMWFKRLYFHGLGEFFYCNAIPLDPISFMELVSCGKAKKGYKPMKKQVCGHLIPVGGGKDSVLTMELLNERMDLNYCYIINPREATIRTAEIAGFTQERMLSPKRTLDPEMLRLNKEGFLNGHTPFSAIVAFSALITAYMYRLEYIVLSNESSANESTVEGSTVNHQYSKSLAFERDFQAYQETYIDAGITYFSLLRPLSEYQIAAFFAGMVSYHDAFRSCNAGSKQDAWCGKCPKCMFVFLILSPFLSHDYLCEIFGRDLMEDDEMLPIFQQLVGILPEKPFECVGSRDEANAAATGAIISMELDEEPLPKMLRYYKETALYAKYRKEDKNYLGYYDHDHLLPPYYERLLKRRCLGGR
ncbi:MAG: hypothetical protein J6L00_05135 [Clostridia bacterium]|nr:hypothetical protein [Clostridia bacterium]